MSSGEELFIWDGWVMRSDVCIVINSNRLAHSHSHNLQLQLS
jgi:hypothetical protein